MILTDPSKIYDENEILRINVSDLEQQLHYAYRRINELNQQLSQQETIKSKKRTRMTSDTINS